MTDASAARENALAVWRSLGSRRKEGDALRWLSRLSWFNGRKAAAEAYASEAATVLEQLPPRRQPALAHSNSAQLHMLEENPAPPLQGRRQALPLPTRPGTTAHEDESLPKRGR